MGQDPQISADKIDMKRLLPVLFIVLVDVLSLTIIIPILPYYALAFDATPFLIGALVTVYPMMQFIFVPILGSLSDRYGRKPVLAAAQIGTFCSLMVLGFAGSLWMLFFARIIDGITGANLATVQSVITDSTTPQNRARGLGLIGATFGVGFVIGPALSGLALQLSGNSYSAPAFLAAGFAFVCVLLTIFMLEESHPPEKRGTGEIQGRQMRRMFSALLEPRLGPLFGLMLGLQLVFGAFHATFAPFTLNRLGMNSFGNTIFFTVFGIAIVVVQGGLVGPLAKRFGERRLVLVGLGLFAVGYLLSSLTPQQTVPWYSQEAMIAELTQQRGTGAETVPTAEQLAILPPEGNSGYWGLIYTLLAVLPIPIGSGLVQPNVNSLITKRADQKKIGEALGLTAAFMALGTAVGPLIGGAIFDLLGPNELYLVCGIAGAILLGIMLRQLKPRPEDEEQPAPTAVAD